MKHPTVRSYLLKAIAIPAVAAVITGCSGTPEAREVKHMERARKFLAEKDYKSAAIEFRIASQNMPKDAEPVYQLAMTYLKTGMAPLAYESFRKASEINPKHEGSRYEVALFRVGSDTPELVEDAKQVLAEYLKAHPNDPEAAGALALAHAKTGDKAQAVALLQAAMKKRPANTRPAMALIGYFGTQGDAETAIRLVRDLTDLIPNSPEIAVLRAEVSLVSADMADVDIQVDRALALRKSYLPALALRLRRELMRGDMQSAEKTTQEVAQQPSKATASAYARMLFSQGRTDAGISEFERVLKQRGDDVQLRNEYSALLIGAGRAKEAGAVIEQTLKGNPKDRLAMLQKISLEINTGSLELAARDIKAMQEMKAFSAALTFEESRLFEARGDIVRQGDLLTEALRANPRFIVARITLARILTGAKQGNKAIQILDDASDAEKVAPDWLYARNMALISAGRWEEVRAGVDQGIKIFKSAGFFYQDAVLRMRSREVSKARTSIDEAYRMTPNDPAVIALLGSVMERQGELKQFQLMIREAAAAKPDSVPLQNSVARLLAITGDAASAKAGFMRARLVGDVVTAETGLAQIDIQAGAFDQAEKRLTELIKTHDNAQARMLLAGIATSTGASPEITVQHYLRAIQLQPDNTLAMNNLAGTLATRTNKLDDARFWAEKAAAREPDDPRLADTLGWILYQQQKFGDALPYLEKSLRGLDRPTAHYHLAAVLAKTGDMARARSEFDTGVKQDPNSPARASAAPFFQGSKAR